MYVVLFYALLLMLHTKCVPNSNTRRCSSGIIFLYFYEKLTPNLMQIYSEYHKKMHNLHHCRKLMQIRCRKGDCTKTHNVQLGSHCIRFLLQFFIFGFLSGLLRTYFGCTNILSADCINVRICNKWTKYSPILFLCFQISFWKKDRSRNRRNAYLHSVICKRVIPLPRPIKKCRWGALGLYKQEEK